MSNKELGKKALTEFFIHHDETALERYWAEDYIQHDPWVPNGAKV